MAHLSSATNWVPDFGRAAFHEPDLVRAARHGDKDAFQRLICQYDRLVLTFALNITDSEDDARAIYEQVFVTAFRSLPSQNLEGSLFLWIYGIAACCCERYLSAKNRGGRSQSSNAEAHTPSASVDARHALNQRLRQLSIRERIVFVMAHCCRLRACTIAEILQAPELSVKQALVRAFYKLNASGVSGPP